MGGIKPRCVCVFLHQSMPVSLSEALSHNFSVAKSKLQISKLPVPSCNRVSVCESVCVCASVSWISDNTSQTQTPPSIFIFSCCFTLCALSTLDRLVGHRNASPLTTRLFVKLFMCLATKIFPNKLYVLRNLRSPFSDARFILCRAQSFDAVKVSLDKSSVLRNVSGHLKG